MKNWSDVNDYFKEIDEGYLTIEQFGLETLSIL